MYVYDLNNCANEFGFTADEGWELNAVSDVRRIEIEKKYYPTVSVKVLPEMLGEFFRLVKDRSAQLKTGIINSVQAANTDRDLCYLVAFNPKRPLR